MNRLVICSDVFICTCTALDKVRHTKWKSDISCYHERDVADRRETALQTENIISNLKPLTYEAVAFSLFTLRWSLPSINRIMDSLVCSAALLLRQNIMELSAYRTKRWPLRTASFTPQISIFSLFFYIRETSSDKGINFPSYVCFIYIDCSE